MSLDRARRWRSLHFVPGASDKMLDKAATLAADALILDLEDAVAPEAKESARERVAEWLDVAKRPVLVQLPQLEYERLRIVWMLP